MGSYTGVLADCPTRASDGARLACPDHPDGQLYRGYTRSGQLKTWCEVHGCPNLAEWVPPIEPPTGRPARGPLAPDAPRI